MHPYLNPLTLFQVPTGGGLHRHHLRCKVPASPSTVRTSRGWSWKDRGTHEHRAFGQRDRRNNKGHQRVSIHPLRVSIHSLYITE